jgi:RNA polymerase sigma-70 factor (ECF subfamily)
VLYQRHFHEVARLVAALGITDADAADVCQEIFLLIHRHLRAWRGEARLSTWMHTIASREAIRFARARRLRRRMIELVTRERAPMPADWADSAAGRRQFLRRALERLAPERRLALVLYEIEGLPVAEIARLCACAENTVWTRLHRARADIERWAVEAPR